MRFLPPAPARILHFTLSTDNLSAWLEAQGYQVSVARKFQEGESIQSPTHTRQGMDQIGWPAAEDAAKGFGAAILQGFSNRIHPLALFNQLDRLLPMDGVVVLDGEYPLAARMPHWLDHAVAIGARCGFDEQSPEPDEVLNADSGFVRVLRKSVVPRWQIRHVISDDFSNIATLFHEVFGHPLSRDLWVWKYGQGRGNAATAARNGVTIAHYGGMYRDILLCGTPEWAFQICDVMVHPEERGVMTRKGPFLLTAATSAEIYGPLGFGFPNARAMLVAEKMGLYAEVGQLVSVTWPSSAPGYRWRTRARALNAHNESDHAEVDALWVTMAQDLQQDVVGVRDWNYLEHRYVHHPHNHYELLMVTTRWSGKPLGLLVLRRVENACELLDVVAPLKNIPLLIDQARRVTGLWGLASLYCWITKNQAQRFIDCGGNEEAINISIPTSCWTDDPRAHLFKNRWWLMAGDTDFR